MGDLSKHFNRSEFACKCGCGKDTVDYNLVFILEEIREAFNIPVKINSANRCESHNKAIGGAERSRHLISQAADIVIDGIPQEFVFNFIDLKYPDTLGLGAYKTFTHIDVRANKARW